MVDEGRFRLLGRLGEMVTVAGKRNNLGALNAALAETPGITSACYVVLGNEASSETRLGIVAVPRNNQMDANTLRRTIRDHMRTLVDPVFIPRQILFTDQIARDATGKITAAEQTRLAKVFR